MITRADVEAAQARIAGLTRRTPLVAAEPVGGEKLWIKAEYMQHCGVFKTRGAFNRQLAARERGELDPAVGIVAASGGNAGLANAFAAKRLGVPATVFVPENAPSVKVERLRSYGATVVQAGTEYAEAYEAAQDRVENTGALFCHAYDQPDIVAGAGVIGLEVLSELPEVDTIVVAVGGGGLYAGIEAAVAEADVRIVAIEPVAVPTLHAALAAGGPVDVSVSGVAADSLGARRIGEHGWAAATSRRPRSVLVEDEAILEARRHLWAEYRMPTEPGAAAAYAALLAGAYIPAADERVVVIACGANTDLATLAQ